MATVKHRTREEGVYDGSTGAQIDTKTVHEVGIEVDGVFVPFLSKDGGYIDALVERGKAARKADADTTTNADDEGGEG